MEMRYRENARRALGLSREGGLKKKKKRSEESGGGEVKIVGEDGELEEGEIAE
jgi:hypothetical protein